MSILAAGRGTSLTAVVGDEGAATLSASSSVNDIVVDAPQMITVIGK